MGACHIEIVPPLPIAGVSRFYTTNGKAYYSPFTRSLVIYDATTVLRFDLFKNELMHLNRPEGWYFKSVEEDEESYRLAYYDGNFGRDEQRISRGKIAFEPGCGKVHDGIFPSACMRYRNPPPLRPRRGRLRWLTSLFKRQ